MTVRDHAELEARKDRREAAERFKKLVRQGMKREMAARLAAERYNKSPAWTYKWLAVLDLKGRKLINFRTKVSKPASHGRQMRALTALFVRSCAVLGHPAEDILTRLQAFGLPHRILKVKQVLKGPLTVNTTRVGNDLFDVLATRTVWDSDLKKTVPRYPYLEKSDRPGRRGSISKAAATAFVEVISAETRALQRGGAPAFTRLAASVDRAPLFRKAGWAMLSPAQCATLKRAPGRVWKQLLPALLPM